MLIPPPDFRPIKKQGALAGASLFFCLKDSPPGRIASSAPQSLWLSKVSSDTGPFA
jgi:hypothetical protein